MYLLKASSLNDSQAILNRVYSTAEKKSGYVKIDDYYYLMEYSESISTSQLGMNNAQRVYHKKALNDPIELTYPISSSLMPLTRQSPAHITFIVSTYKVTCTLDCDDITQYIKQQLLNTYVNNKQVIVIVVNHIKVSLCHSGIDDQVGIITDECTFSYISSAQYKPTLLNCGDDPSSSTNLFKTGLKLTDLGIGGLSDEFDIIFRQAFASRAVPKSLIQRMGIEHTKGILLSGPPGCGKTLMARKIGQLLNCVPPKIVNGPELLNKFVGQSEENVRNLFVDAINDTSDNLHLIIIDEIDSLTKSRGSGGDNTGVSDRIVNQFLSMIDGPNKLNNILIIGMTNRKDIIDEALLRAGRLELHIEINLPTESGRLEILNIHTAKIREGKFIDEHVSLSDIAHKCHNFTGAEIESLVKNASSYALSRQLVVDENGHIDKKSKTIVPLITENDFTRAIDDMKPLFGKQNKTQSTDFIFWHDDLIDFKKEIIQSVNKLKNGMKLTFLIQGNHGIGKTSFIDHMLNQLDISCVRYICPQKFLSLGCGEGGKATYITNMYNECCKSEQSILVLDNIERLIEFTEIGMRFNNTVVQVILSILNGNMPNPARKMVIFITSSNSRLTCDLELNDSTDHIYQYPYVVEDDSVIFKDHSIKSKNISELFKVLKYSD